MFPSHDQTMEFVTQNADKIPYKKRLQIGILLDVPADSTLVPQNIMSLQKTFTSEEEQAQPGTDLGAVDFADQAQSGTEKITNRE